MDIGRYRHNYEGFNKKLTYQIFINKGRMTITQDAHASFVLLSFFFFLLLVKSFEEEIQPSRDRVHTARG